MGQHLLTLEQERESAVYQMTTEQPKFWHEYEEYCVIKQLEVRKQSNLGELL